MADLVGPEYLRVVQAFVSARGLCRMASCRLSDLVVVRRRVRAELIQAAGELAAGPATVCVFVGQAEIRNLWAGLTTSVAAFASGAMRQSLDVLTFNWAPGIDASDDRAVLLVGLVPVLARPEIDERTWTFVRADGTETRWTRP